ASANSPASAVASTTSSAASPCPDPANGRAQHHRHSEARTGGVLHLAARLCLHCHLPRTGGRARLLCRRFLPAWTGRSRLLLHFPSLAVHDFGAGARHSAVGGRTGLPPPPAALYPS